MWYFIFGTLVIYLLIEFPLECFFMAVILFGLNLFYKEEEPTAQVDPEIEELRKLYGEDNVTDDGIILWEKYHADKVEDMLRPGFRDDPEWKRKSEELKKHMAEQREKELQEELNEELRRDETPFWNKNR